MDPALDSRFHSSRDRLIREGSGWRVGWDPAAAQYRGLLAGADWAVELTAEEWQDFRRLVQQLVEAAGAIAPELMPEEHLTCDGETPLVWVELDGDSHTYGLRFILLTGRGAEGAWPPPVVPHLLRGLGSLP